MPIKFVFDDQLLGIWMLFHQTYNSISRCEDKEFGKLGISARQHAILMAIMESGGSATPTQIAKWVDRNNNSITLILDRMEKRGLVKRIRDTNDRRSLNVEMTQKGVEVLRQGIEVGWSLIQDLLSSLSSEEMRIMANSLEKLRHQSIIRCYPDNTMEVINIDKQHHLSKFINKATDKSSVKHNKRS